MAKYEVKFSCGHTARIELFGKETDRQKKIAYYEEHGMCPDCYKEQKDFENSCGCEEREMHYGEYKNNFSDCKTKANSYNKNTKTIIVYIPSDYEAKKDCVNELKAIGAKENIALALIKDGSEMIKNREVPESSQEMQNQVVEILEKYGF